MSDYLSYVNTNQNSFVGQSSMGLRTSIQTEKDRSWNHGYLALGKVLNVFPKRYTAEVEIFHTLDQVGRSSNEFEGRHACRIGVGAAGFSDQYEAPYGEIIPIQRGNIVLVGFLKNKQNNGVILRVFHSTTEEVGSSNYRNILPNTFSEYANIGDILDYLKITPIQDFLKVDRFGNIEMSSHTKSFFVAKENGLIDDKFDYEDLSVKFPKDKTVINPNADFSDLYDTFKNITPDLSSETIHVEESHSKPKKYMAVFRDKFTDSETNWLKLIVDASRTSFRLLQLQQKNNRNTMFDVDEDGTVRIRRQLDARQLFDNDTPQTDINPTQNPSKIYSEVQLLADGTIKLETVDRTNADPNLKTGFSSEGTTDADESQDFPHTLITINPKGGNITIETNNKLSAYAKNGVNISSKNNININSDSNVNVTSKKNINLNSENNINIIADKAINIKSVEGINVISTEDIIVNSETATRVTATENVVMSAPDMYLTGAMDMKGSIDMVGAVDVIGNANFTGKHRINFRGAILDGDVDTWGDFNLEFFCNYVVDMVESFAIKKLCSKMGINLGDAAAVMGILNVATNGFSFENISFDGIASTLEDVAFGVLIDTVSPFYNELVEFCNINNFLPNSISAQLDFLGNMLEKAGLDLNNLGNKALGGLGGTVDALNTLQSVFGHKNNLISDITAVLNISQEFTLSDLQMPLLQLACEELNINLKADNLVSNIINIAAGGDPRALLGNTINTISRSMLGNTADTTSIIHEGDIIESQGNGNKEQEQTHEQNEHNNDGDGTQHHQQTGDGDDNEDDKTTYKVATIEDALASLEKYFSGDLTDQVKLIERVLDEQTGSDVSHYADTNRTNKSSKKEQLASGEVTTTSRPAAIDTIDQYLDRTVKRYVFTNCERMINQINAAWKYYNYGV